MHWHNNMMGWWGGYGMIVFWVIIIIVVILLIKMLMSNTDGKQQDKETPLEILNRRYASGEIDREEYEEKRKDITR